MLLTKNIYIKPFASAKFNKFYMSELEMSYIYILLKKYKTNAVIIENKTNAIIIKNKTNSIIIENINKMQL